MSKKKIDLQPGVKYKGYGFVNEYGEFEFTPEQTGSRKGQKRFIKTGDRYTVSETRDLVIVHISVPKVTPKLKLVKDYLEVVNQTLLIIKDYEI